MGRAGRRRKERLVREDGGPEDELVLLRAAPADRRRALRNAVDDANDSGSTYVVVHRDGRRGILFGMSMFACRAGQTASDVLVRFRASPCYLEVTVGAIRSAGFVVWPTGSNPDHFDIQLLPGLFEDDTRDVAVEELRGAAARLLWAAGELRPNPGYAGRAPDDEPEV